MNTHTDHSVRAIAGRVSLGVVDQLLSSSSNFIALLVAARLLANHSFGSYALASTTYIVALGTSRGLCGEALLVRIGDDDGAKLSRSGRAAMDSVTFGLVLLPILLVVAISTRGETGGAFAVLAFTLPLLLLQDTFRYGSLARNSPKLAMRSDLLWILLQVPAYAIVLAFHARTAPAMFLAWAATGSIAGLVALAFDGVKVKPSLTFGWARENIDLGGRYVVDFLAGTGVAQVASYALVIVSGVSALGALRGAQTIFGPMNVLISGAYIAFVPEAQRVARRSTRSLTLLCAGIAVGLAAGSAALTALFLMLPDSGGRMLLGSQWKSATTVLLPVGLASMAGGLFAGASTGIRAVEGAKELLRARVYVVPFSLIVPVVGAWRFHLNGAAYGIAAASWWGLIWWWRAYGKSIVSYDARQSTRSVAPATDDP